MMELIWHKSIYELSDTWKKLEAGGGDRFRVIK